MESIFDFNDYKLYLKELMPSSGEGRGQRSKLAEALGCQLSFLSLVLNKQDTHLSLEHGKSVCEFFQLSEEETRFFLLLLSKKRSGSKSLEDFYNKEIKKIQIQREEIKHRISDRGELSREDQAIYYSEWYFAALHMILRNEKKLDLKKVSEVINVPYEKTLEAVAFLEKVGIVKSHGGRYEVLDVRFHVDSNSPWVNLHHRNWRQKSISFLEQKRPENLNYTLIMSISEDVAKKVRDLLLNSIQKTEPYLKEAPDQTVYNLNVDFYKVY